MRIVRSNLVAAQSVCQRAFTLIELLIVIAIIALLISILLPALQAAREETRKTVCVTNMRSIGVGVNQYLGNDGQVNLPWTYVQSITAGNNPQPQPWQGDGDGPMGLSAQFFSSYSWGGSLASKPYSGDGRGDFAVTPADVRPLNKYLDGEGSGLAVIKATICPGDRSAVSPIVGENLDNMNFESDRTSFEAYGNSYSINWFFMEEPDIHNWNIRDLFNHGLHAVRMNSGAKAAEWVIMWENQCDQLFVGATVNGVQGHFGPGWHRKFSHHTFLFLDGHVEHRYFDTRRCKGPGWRIWRKWQLFNEPPFLDPPFG